MDSRGRILIPTKERKKLGLKAGTEFEIFDEEGIVLLKPVVSTPLKVNSKKKSWGSEAFSDAGEATFGE